MPEARAKVLPDFARASGFNAPTPLVSLEDAVASFPFVPRHGMPEPRMWKSLLPYLALTAATLVFFAEFLLQPAGILYADYSDFVALHIPARQFLVRSFQETGEIPLWDPYAFAGSPFVHDMQLAMFYPPHLLLLWVDEAWVGTALSWLIVLHVWLAGVLMYVYARRQDMGPVAALVAAFGYMFAGRWLLHLLAGGHYLIVGLAWLPLLMLCLDRAIRMRRWYWAVCAGLLFGLVAIGTQPQWSFYAGILIALWTLGEALTAAGYWTGETTRVRLRSSLLCWAGFGLATALLGIGIAAIQLLPAWEATRYSLRASGIDLSQNEVNPLLPLLLAVGPALSREPTILMWENRGGLTLIWLITAWLAPVLAGGIGRYRAGVAAVLMVFAFGGSALVQNLPGFSFFRHHSRMFIVAAFPLSLMAGMTIQKLFAAGAPQTDTLTRCRMVARLLFCAAAVLVIGGAIQILRSDRYQLQFHIYWVTLGITLPLLFWLLRPGCPLPLHKRQWLWGLLLVIDLWALTWPLVQVRDPAEVYAASASVQYLIENNPGHHRTLDRIEPNEAVPSPLGKGTLLSRTYGIPSLNGFNPIDVLRYREYLQRLSGQDRELKAFDPDPSGFGYPILRDYPIRNREMLNLLGVRYLLQPAKMPVDEKKKDQAPPFQYSGWEQRLVDSAPHTYDLDQGVIALPPYIVYENTQVYPRAFVVPEVKPLPPRPEVLPALAAADFRKTVFLETTDPDDSAPLPRDSSSDVDPDLVMSRNVTIRGYQPNEVVLDVGDGPAGILVLTDIYYPGWKCTVNGVEQRDFRADYLFRAVAVGEGKQTVTFSFEPASYTRGRQITLGALAVVGGLLLLAVVLRWASPAGKVGFVGGNAIRRGSSANRLGKGN
jgi:hypothetical protein